MAQVIIKDSNNNIVDILDYGKHIKEAQDHFNIISQCMEVKKGICKIELKK